MSTTDDHSVPRLTEAEIADLVKAIVENRVFTSQHVDPSAHPSMLGRIFTPVAFGIYSDWTTEELMKIGTVYEYRDLASKVIDVEGYPVFFSCRLVHIDDWLRVCDGVQAEEDKSRHQPLTRPS